jgi:hypothetical protein
MKMLSVVNIFPDSVQRIHRCSPSDVFLKSFAPVYTVLVGSVAANWTVVDLDTHTVMLLHLFAHPC